MSRLAQAFARARDEHRAALVGYLTAGDPDLATCEANVLAACQAGLDVLELGVPFSDPAADGPDVQGAMVRALEAGTTLDAVLEMAARLRYEVDTPIVLFSYANPLFRADHGLAERVAAAGIDALLVVDMPPQHASILRAPARAADLDWIGLVAPTTTPQRLDAISEVTTGFVYAVTLRGVTGAAVDVEGQELSQSLARLRDVFEVPVVAGFGIRTPGQVQALVRGHVDGAPLVDGVVVGSALIRAAGQGQERLVALVRELARATARV